MTNTTCTARPRRTPIAAHHNGVTYPICRYCTEPLTDSERDPEDGGFYSAHYRCTASDPAGRFAVEERRFTTLARAQEHARYLADANFRRSFLVWDHELGRYWQGATMDREEARRSWWYYAPEVAAELRIPRPVHPIAGTPVA